MSIVQLNGVTKQFGTVTAVDNATFSVERGQILSLLGPSGCGKTTTLRMIAGFEDPSEGEILISDQSVLGKRPYERNVGLLFQDYALFPHMTVEQNVAYGLKRRNYQRVKLQDRVNEMLDLVKLEGFEARRPSQLSGGQQQRVALARALATSPEVVLLDEPLSALDAKLRQELRIELKQILSTVDATTIIVTHDQEEAMSLGDTLVVMSEGKVVQIGEPTEIYRFPKTKFVAEFIGRSNWLKGKLGQANSDGFFEFELYSGKSIFVSEPVASAHRYEVCIRPEQIRVFTDEQYKESSNFENHLSGSIQNVAHLGADFHLVIKLETDGELTVREQFTSQSVRAHSDRVHVVFQPNDCIVVPAGD